MATVEIIGDDALEVELREFPAKAGRAIVRALNRSIQSGRTVMVRAIAGDTGLQQKSVREALVMREATATNPAASLAAPLKRVPLIKFLAKGPVPSRGRGHGVTYRLPGGRGRVENAFIATMRGGHTGVFKRVRNSRVPITELHGPSLGHVFKKFRPAALARAYEVFQKNFDHELAFVKSGGPSADAD